MGLTMYRREIKVGPYLVYLEVEGDLVVHELDNGVWERNSLLMWAQEVQSLEAGTEIWDVGAYTGIYALLAYAVEPYRGHTIRAFEPHPTVYQRLYENVEYNTADAEIEPAQDIEDADSRVIAYNRALSSSTGFGKFHVTGASLLPSASSLELHKTRDDLTTPDVVVVTGDQFHSDRNGRPVKLIKIDVENHELSVLQGLENVLNTYHPTLFIELLSEEQASSVFAYLLARGYTHAYQIDEQANESIGTLPRPVGFNDAQKLCGPGKNRNFVFRYLPLIVAG